MATPALRRWGLLLGKGAAFVLVVAALSEVSLRVMARRYERNRPTMEHLATSTTIMHRLWGQWLDKKQPHPFAPPFTVFSNRDPDDLERLRAAYEHARLPPSKSWQVSDFLQSPEKAEEHRFQVTSNALGFRDPERSLAKPAGTYRILCLGAYQTFGLGVDDDQTFPRVLEGLLNAGAKRGTRYEVWNGGLPSATAILGLSRLQLEVFKFQPDLVILDYGFVDAVTLDDNLMPVALRLPSKNTPSRVFKRFLGWALSSPLAKSYLINKTLQRAMHLHRGESLEAWQGVMTRMIGLVRGRGIPVVLLDQGWSLFPDSTYESLAASDRGVQFLSVRRLFQQFPPSEAQLAKFEQGYNWAREFEPFDRGTRKDWAYQIDIFHPNSAGYEVIGKALAERVRRLAKIDPA